MNVLIIGLGSIAIKHISALEQLCGKRLQLYALRSSKTALPREGVANVYNLDNLDFIPDFIIISNPTVLHDQTIDEALRFNASLFIEKPSLHSLQNASILSKKIQQKKIITYVGCNLRFHPALMYLNAIKDSNGFGRINEINAYCGSYLPEWRPNADFRKIYSANTEMGGGVHLDLIHELDYLYWLFGAPLHVSSMRRNKSHLNISAMDYANYILEYDTFVSSVVLNYYRRDTKRTLEIVCEEATWEVDLLREAVFKNKQLIFGTETTKLDIKAMYGRQMEYFLDCLKTKKMPMNSFDDSLEVLKMCIGN